MTQCGWHVSSSLSGSFPSMHLLTSFFMPGCKKQNNKTQTPSFFFFQHCIQHSVKITVAPNTLNEYAFMVQQPPESLSCRCKKVILKQWEKETTSFYPFLKDIFEGELFQRVLFTVFIAT